MHLVVEIKVSGCDTFHTSSYNLLSLAGRYLEECDRRGLSVLQKKETYTRDTLLQKG